MKSHNCSFKINKNDDDGPTRTSSKKSKLNRKNTSKFEDPNKDKRSDRSSTFGGQYIILPEYTREQCYSELLPKVLKYDENLNNNIGLWREHGNFLDKFSETL